MKIEFIRSGAGFGLGYHAGEVADLAEKQAEKLIEAGVCIPAKSKSKKAEQSEDEDEDENKEVETATSKATPEKAVKKK